MIRYSLLLVTLLLASSLVRRVNAEAIPDVVLAVHGGTAGADATDKELAAAQRADMKKALRAGYEALQKAEAMSLDGVEAAVRVLEDSPHFNAGRGAVFSRDGFNELDASIMDGRTKRGGAVACVRTIKNPVSAARAVMEHTPHVLLEGRGAEVFATRHGLEIVDPQYFWTERRWKQLEGFWKQKSDPANGSTKSRRIDHSHEWSTVGAVAVDRAKNVAAATSTGGLTGKMAGRIGDSPILGAGNYADNASCAVSGTGQGEYFIRLATAHEVGVLMKYKKLPVDQAAAEAIAQITSAGGPGGVIALDQNGNFSAPYNTPGMHRGYITRDGQVKVLLHSE